MMHSFSCASLTRAYCDWRLGKDPLGGFGLRQAAVKVGRVHCKGFVSFDTEYLEWKRGTLEFSNCKARIACLFRNRSEVAKGNARLKQQFGDS